MFNLKTSQPPSALDKAIASIHDQLDSYDADSREYAAMVDQLEKLYKMKASNKANTISADTLAIIGGNLAGILLILNFERMGVVASKALGLVIKTKI